MSENSVEVIDLTNVQQEQPKEVIQEVGEIFTQIVNELVGLRSDLKPMGVKIIKKYTDEINDLYDTIDKMKEKLEDYKGSSERYYNLFEKEKDRNEKLEKKFEQLLEKLQIKYLGEN
jgi:DNA repair ATPase RecN